MSLTRGERTFRRGRERIFRAHFSQRGSLQHHLQNAILHMVMHAYKYLELIRKYTQAVFSAAATMCYFARIFPLGVGLKGEGRSKDEEKWVLSEVEKKQCIFFKRRGLIFMLCIYFWKNFIFLLIKKVCDVLTMIEITWDKVLLPLCAARLITLGRLIRKVGGPHIFRNCLNVAPLADTDFERDFVFSRNGGSLFYEEISRIFDNNRSVFLVNLTEFL